jgi:hypothetical protein
MSTTANRRAWVAMRCGQTRQLLIAEFHEIRERSWGLQRTTVDASGGGGSGKAGALPQVSGHFVNAYGYEGCAVCRATHYMQCNAIGCRRLSCWSGHPPPFTCAWCSTRGYPSGPVTLVGADDHT